MANLFAQSSGDWTAILWNTAANGSGSNQVPTIGDVCMANSFSISITTSVTVAEVRNDTTAGATNGGSFTLFNGAVLTANSYGGTVTNLVTNLAANESATVVGNISNKSGSSTGVGIYHGSTGTLNITGNIYKNGGYTGVQVLNGGKLNFTGNIYTPNVGGTEYGMYLNNVAGYVVNIVGNIIPSTVTGVATAIAGTLNITGTIYGGSSSGSCGVSQEGSTPAVNVSIIGDIIGSSASTTAYGVSLNTPQSITVVGNISGDVSYGVYHTGTGNLTITGNVTGGSNYLNGAGVYTNSGRVNVYGTAIAGPGITGSPGAYGASSSYPIRVQNFQMNGTTGAMPFFGRVKVFTPFPAMTWQIQDSTGTLTTLYANTALAPGSPNPSDVRYGTMYQNNGITGTLRIPPVNTVTYGVPVDNTVGTAALTVDAIWNAQTSTMTTAGSIGKRIKNAATTDEVSAIVSGLK